MRFLFLFVFTFAASNSFAEDQVSGTASRAMDGLSRTCQAVQDTSFGGSAYILYAPAFSLVRDTFSFSVTTQGLRCRQIADKFSWQSVSVTAPVEYNMDGADGLLRVRSWLDLAEFMLTDSDLNLIGTKVLRGGTVEEVVSFRAPLEKILSVPEWQNWNREGKAKFRLQITLRGIARYSVNDGPAQTGGLRAGGTFILQGEIHRTADGSVITLTK